MPPIFWAIRDSAKTDSETESHVNILLHLHNKDQVGIKMSLHTLALKAKKICDPWSSLVTKQFYVQVGNTMHQKQGHHNPLQTPMPKGYQVSLTAERSPEKRLLWGGKVKWTFCEFGNPLCYFLVGFDLEAILGDETPQMPFNCISSDGHVTGTM